MKTNNKPSEPVLQAPSFEEAQASLFIMIQSLHVSLRLTDEHIKLIDKRLDILDQVVLNIPREEK